MAVDKEASGGRQGERAKRASIQVTPREMRGIMMATKTSLEVEEVTAEEKEEEKINEAKYCERKNLSGEDRKPSFSDMQVG